jgi:predicted nucleotidyltransferase component of viral defense system
MKLHWTAVNNLLKTILHRLNELPEIEPFRLVGGTGLALQLGHRISNDLDLFTDDESVDLQKIDILLRETFNYVDQGTTDSFQIGLMRFIGNSPEQSIKLDLFFTDKFIRAPIVQEGIKLASVEDIAAMKLELITRGGRKKDFWDLMEIIDHYNFPMLIDIFREKYPYLEIDDLLAGLTDFTLADEQEDPVCLRGRIWELIKLDIEEIFKNHRKE